MGLKDGGLRASVRSVSTVVPAFFDVAITNTNSPINEGDVLLVDFSVDNTGESFATQDIRLEIDSVQEDADLDVSLSGGASDSGTLEWDTTGQSAATYEATVLSDDDSDTVTVEIPDAFFDVAIQSTNSPVVEGEMLNVDYFVDNTGGVEDTQDIRLEIDNTQEDVDTGVTLDSDTSTTGTLQWDTTNESAATYSATVLSDDDSDSVTVEVESPISLVAYGGEDNNTYVHDVSDGSLVQTLTESGDNVRGVALSDTHVAYGGNDDNTYVHDVSDGSLVQTLTESGSSVNGVALSDTHVAYGGVDANTYVHDVSDGSLVQTLTEADGGFSGLLGVALSDTHVAYGGDDDNTYVHDVSDGSLVHTLTRSGDRVNGVALSDTHVAYGGRDDNTYVHDVSDGSLVQTLTEAEGNVNDVALSDTHVAYGGDDANTYVHDLSDGSLVQTLTEEAFIVQGVALSDTHVAYGGNDDNTYVHDVSDGSLVQTLTESGATVLGVALL